MWRRFVPLGLASVGLGLSLAGEATLRMGRGAPLVLYGTAAPRSSAPPEGG
jgi:hypothetical protein